MKIMAFISAPKTQFHVIVFSHCMWVSVQNINMKLKDKVWDNICLITGMCESLIYKCKKWKNNVNYLFDTSF